MAYKVGSTTVIDNNGDIDWDRISSKPTGKLQHGTGTHTLLGTDELRTLGSGNIVPGWTLFGIEFDSQSAYHKIYERTLTNCNCDCACYC